MVKVNKNKGIALVEIILIAIILTIILWTFIPAFWGTLSDSNVSQQQTTEDIGREQFRNEIRTSQTVKLKRYKDGTLWACNTRTKNCYKVEK